MRLAALSLGFFVFLFTLPTQSQLPASTRWEHIKIKRTYAEVIKELEELAARHTDSAEIFELGVADSGAIIKGLRIGDGPIHNLLVGTHHGNEFAAAELALAFASHALEQPLDEQTLWIIPVLNASGYDRRDRYERAGFSSYDPNRDYPGPCGSDGPFHLKSTRALADFIARVPVVNAATIHTYMPAVLYPWGNSTDHVDTEHTAEFVLMAQDATFLSHYTVGNSTAELYPADGTFEDYAYWTHGVWAMLFEVGTNHNPSENQVAEMIRTNVPGLRRMFERGPIERATPHVFQGPCSGWSKILDQRVE